MSIEGLTVERLDYDLGRVIGDDAEARNRIERLLPPPDHLLSFRLLDSTTAMANAIRRVGMAELLNACLTTPLEGIQTYSLVRAAGKQTHGTVHGTMVEPDRNFIPVYFLLRLQHIKIPPNTQGTFSLKVENLGDKPKVIYSSMLQGQSGTEVTFSPTYRLGVLQPGYALEVPEITVVQGYGYTASCFYSTGKVAYANLDYRPADILGRHGLSDMYWVRAEEVRAPEGKKDKASKGDKAGKKDKAGKVDKADKGDKKDKKDKKDKAGKADKAGKEAKSKYGDLLPTELTHRPLFIPKAGFATESGKGAIRERLEDWDDVRFVDELPEGHSSMAVRCRNYFLAFRLESVYDPHTHLQRILDTLAERLSRLEGELPRLLASDTETVLRVTTVAGDDRRRLILVLEGEDDTLGQLLREKIYDLDQHTFVNCMTHPRRERTLVLRLAHPAAEELLGRAIAACLADVRGLRAQLK